MDLHQITNIQWIDLILWPYKTLIPLEKLKLLTFGLTEWSVPKIDSEFLQLTCECFGEVRFSTLCSHDFPETKGE